MIPKIIHYCWFGGKKLPKSALRCIESWKKFLPDYQIKEWNEDNFNFDECIFAKEAYENKKYAFVSDYARFKILYDEGGVYFDTDVELIKPFDDIISTGPYFGLESGSFKRKIYDTNYLAEIDYNKNERVTLKTDFCINPGLGMASEKNNMFYKKIIDMYMQQRFVNSDGTMNLLIICDFITAICIKKTITVENGIGKVENISIYPKEYFAPKNPETRKLNITDKTYSIHHYDATWFTLCRKIIQSIIAFCIFVFGKKYGRKIAWFICLPFSLFDRLSTEGFTKTVGLIKSKIFQRQINN